MIRYDSVQQLVEEATAAGKNISDLVLSEQAEQTGRSREDLYREMEQQLQVMEAAVERGMNTSVSSPSGLSGGDAQKIKKAIEAGRTISGGVLSRMLAKSVATAEVNACMGRIVAAPTGGSCGIIPAVLLTLQEVHGIPRDRVVMALFTAGGIGMVIASRASISGAAGGCQAECGSAAAMAAAAAVEMMGGTPQMSAQACAIALKGVLGLVCDPVAGLVEVPCIKRNAAGSANALAAAELALAGVESRIPVDEVILAMKSIGDKMAESLKETAGGGLAATPIAKRLTEELLGRG